MSVRCLWAKQTNVAYLPKAMHKWGRGERPRASAAIGWPSARLQAHMIGRIRHYVTLLCTICMLKWRMRELSSCSPSVLADVDIQPAIAQLVEHLGVVCSSNQMVPGSIPGGRILHNQFNWNNPITQMFILYQNVWCRCNFCSELHSHAHRNHNGSFWSWFLTLKPHGNPKLFA